jgi:hypothetical protein
LGIRPQAIVGDRPEAVYRKALVLAESLVAKKKQGRENRVSRPPARAPQQKLSDAFETMRSGVR